MENYFFSLGLVLSLLVSGGRAQGLQTATPEAVGVSEEHLTRLDHVIESAIASGETPGAVVLVARKGRVVYKKAFGHRAVLPRLEPMTIDTIFDVASLTKILATAAAVMILVEDGKLSLSDPVGTYLPDFARHEKGDVTVLDLMIHYSGLRPDLDLDPPWNGYETALERAYEERLQALPGERFVYSDINYLVLAEIVRKCSGKSLHEFATERIFWPLGMHDTGFSQPSERVPRIAPTMVRDGKMLRGDVHDPTAYRMGGITGHAGLFSTVQDTAIYTQMILNEGIYRGTRVLSPLSVRKMTTSQSPPGKHDLRGLGFDIRTAFSGAGGDLFPVDSFGHTGFTGTSLWIDRNTRTLVVLFANRLHPEGKGSVISLRKKVASVVAASIVDLPPSGRRYPYLD